MIGASPPVSRSIASDKGRGFGVSRCSATAIANRIAMQAMKITQPSKKCRNPSACSMP